MKKEIYQIVVKYHVTNKISLYEFTDFKTYVSTLNQIKSDNICLLITTNVYIDE